MKKQLLILFAFISVLALSQVPQRFNKVIVTGDITSPKYIKTGSNADSVLLGNGSARAISTIKTDTVSLSNRINAKAAGNGTANGTNTGDETLTSIKTKLGAATPVSDGYLRYQDFADFADRVSNATHTGDVTGSAALTLATVNSNVGTFNNVTINAKGLATAGSNVSYEPSFTKNTAFNKNFGTTTGTVLEGRTFGSAANSAVGDFQPAITSLTTNYIPKWNGSTFVNATAGTDYQLPITLTTNGTSGAATFSGNVLNVPNYGNVATSGTYIPALTNYSNIASSSAFEAMYMHIGNMYSLSIKAAITPSTAGSCTLRITLPQQSNNKTGVFSVTSISNDQSTVLPSFTYTVGGADYVGVVVNVPSTDPITLTVTGMYTHQ